MNFKSSFRCFSLTKSSSVLCICILIFLPVMTLLLTITSSSEEESSVAYFSFRLSFRSFLSFLLFFFLDLCFLFVRLCLCLFRERLLLSSELESPWLHLLLSELEDLDLRRLLCFLSRRREESRERSSLSSFLSAFLLVIVLLCFLSRRWDFSSLSSFLSLFLFVVVFPLCFIISLLVDADLPLSLSAEALSKFFSSFSLMLRWNQWQSGGKLIHVAAVLVQECT